MQRRVIRLGPLVLDTSDQALVRGADRTVLQPKIFEALRYLAENAPRLVSREELLEAVWGGVAVTENTVDQALGKIRKALGPDRDLLDTVPRRGWRIQGEVRQELIGEADATRPEVAPALYGRAEELRAIAGLLAGPDQLVTLLGPGGIGKTTLARAALAAWGPGGRFVDLAACRSAVDVVAVVADLLGVPAQSGGGLGESLAHAMASSGVSLWVLDNAEQVSEALAPLVARWAEASPSARFLATSRHRLGLRHEKVVEIGPLAPDEAADLLRARVEALDVGVGADLTDADARAVAGAVEGVPLALELAATRLLVTPADDLARQLRSTLLDPAFPTAHPDRQRSIEATLRWSWSLLPDWARDAAEQLSVFRGPFEADLAEAVLALPPDAPPPLQALGALRGRSLLSRDAHDGAPRLRMLDAVRTWAQRSLVARGAERACHEAHARAVLDRVRAWIGFRPSTLPFSARVATRHLVPELQAVWERALARGDRSEAARAALVLSRHHHAQGLYDEVERVLAGVVESGALDGSWVERVALEHAYALSRTKGPAAAKEALAALEDRLSEPLRPLWRLRWLGVRNDVGERDVLPEIRALVDASSDDPWLQASALLVWLSASARADTTDDLLGSAHRCVALAEGSDDEVLHLAALNALYEVQRRLGDSVSAEATLVRGIAHARAIGVPVSAAGMSVNLSIIRGVLEDVEGSAEAIEAAREIAGRIGNRNLDAFIALRSGVIEGHERHGLDAARARFAYARTLFEALGRTPFVAGTWTSQGTAAVLLGAVEEARDCARRALDVAPNDSIVRWRTRLILAQAALLDGDPDAVSALVDEGMRHLGVGWGHVVAEFRAVECAAWALGGDGARARGLADAARAAMADVEGVTRRWVPLVVSLAEAASGDEAPARHLLAATRGASAEITWARDLVTRGLQTIRQRAPG